MTTDAITWAFVHKPLLSDALSSFRHRKNNLRGILRQLRYRYTLKPEASGRFAALIAEIRSEEVAERKTLNRILVAQDRLQKKQNRRRIDPDDRPCPVLPTTMFTHDKPTDGRRSRHNNAFWQLLFLYLLWRSLRLAR